MSSTSSRVALLLPLLLALLCLSAAPATAQTYYSFCYYQQNTLATSPYLPWSTYAQGTFSVTAANTTLTVVGVTGTREVYVQGKPLLTNNILGVTAPLVYMDNTNVLSSVAPYISGRNAVSFYLDGIAQFANGPAVSRLFMSGTNNVSINAWAQYSYTGATVYTPTIAEADMPPNDMQTNVILSGFQLAPATSFTNSYAGCTLTRPGAPSISSTVLTAYNTLTTWPMCYQFVFGNEGLGRNGFITTVSGVITTRGYQGASPSGALTGYLAVGINGTRNYTVQSNSLNIPSVSYIISLVAIGSPLSPYANFPNYASTSTLRRYVNNVLYPSFPQIDQWGLTILSNASVLDEYSASVTSVGFDQDLIGSAQTNTTSFILYTDSSFLVYDVIWKLNVATAAVTVTRDSNWADTLNVQTQAQYNALVPTTYANQAAWTTGVCGNDYTVTPTKYSFCYYIDSTSANVSTVNRGLTYVYGTFTAKTGLTRYGKPAMQAQGMNGVRVFLNLNTSVTLTSSIVQLLPPNALFEDYLISEGYWWLTDNIIFTQAPYLSEAGLAVRFATYTGSNPSYPLSNTGLPSQAITPYMNIYSTWATSAGPYGLTEYAMGDLNFPYSPYTPNISLSNFVYTPYVAGQLASCSADNKVTMATTSFSFCWWRQSTGGYINQFQAQMYVYSNPVLRNGRAGYVLQGFVGLRTYSDKNGIMQSDVIQGIDGDTLIFSSGGVGWQFDNLVFLTPPYLSAGGLAYSVNGPLGDFETYLSPTVVGSGLAETNVGRLWYDELGATFGGTPPYNYYDESLFNVSSPYNLSTNSANGAETQDLWYYIDLTGPYNNVQVVQDNGASAIAGTTLQSYCNQPKYMLYSFSYSLTQTMTTSPYLPWNVFVTGYLNVSTVSGQYWTGGPGYQVVGAVGTRTIQFANKVVTNNIIGLAPPKTWQSNDNLINLGAPFLSPQHVLSFQLDGVANFATGPIPGVTGTNSTFVSLSNFTGAYATTGMGIQEMDNGVNDGILQTISSQWDIRLCANFSDLVACGYTSPLVKPTITWASSALTAYQSTSQVSMCFSVTQGPGAYGNVGRGYYVTTITAILTITNWGSAVGTIAGAAYNGPAYLITAATGNRTYSFPDGTQQVIPFVLGGMNAAVKHFPAYLTTSPASISSNNIYYPTFPQLDAKGIQFQGVTDFDNNGEAGDYHSNVDHVYWSGSDWREANTDYSLALYTSGITYNNYGGNAVFVPTTNGADQTNAGGSCQLAYGPPLLYSYCYYINNTGMGANGYVTYANGIVTAVGPQSRYSRQAIAVTGMTGVRVLAMNNGSTYPQNIIGVQYVDADTFYIGTTRYVWLTDDLIFPTGVPEVSLLGLSYITANPVEMPAGAGGTDVIISTDGLASGNNLYECVGSENFCIQSLSYSFKSAPYTTGGPMVSCQTAALPQVPAPPSLLSYDFCYAMNGADQCGYTIASAGTITVFNSPVTVNGRVGYPMANITGTRTYSNGQGVQYTATISGLSEDWQAVQNGWSYDQLFFPTSTPNVDSLGILYRYSGVVNNMAGQTPFYFDRVVRLFANATNPAVEEVWISNGTAPYTTRYFLQNGLIKTGAQGSLSASTCSASLGATGFTGQCAFVSTAGNGGTTTTPGGSSSSSGLSGGQIAGIVVGTVIGAALFCGICFALGLTGAGASRGKKQGGEKSMSEYDKQQDVSKVGQSQVELQTADRGEEIA